MSSVVAFYYQLHSLISIIISISTIVICIYILPTIIVAMLSCLYINYEVDIYTIAGHWLQELNLFSQL